MTIRMKSDDLTGEVKLRYIKPGQCFQDGDGDICIKTDEDSFVVLTCLSCPSLVGTIINIDDSRIDAAQLVELIVSEVRNV